VYKAAVAEAHQVTEAASGALVQTGNASAEITRTAYGSQLADATRTADRLRAAIEGREEEMRRELNRQLAEMRATLAPLQERLKQLKEGIWTVNLYLGRDEEIEQIADGEPAPVGTPITLRQLVLAMDEECLVAAEDGGIDARRVDDFAAWLTENPAHLHQVMPDPKGVVILVPSRQDRNYGDMFINEAMHKANTTSHWLIRNGDRVYLMTTDLNVGNRMLPRRAEFEDFFYERDLWSGRPGERKPLDPGSDAWVKAEQKADARRRHYMRIMLVLQGLADRTTVFQPLDAPVSFLSLAAQDNGQVRIVNEIDNVLETGRPSFTAWLRDLNARLDPGMRIIGAFRGEAWRNASGYERSYDKHSRLRPETAPNPQSGVIYTVEDRAPGGALVFRYKRTDTVDDYDRWGRYRGQRAPKTRASCMIHPDEDEFVLPFDLVTVPEMEAYLNSRTERHAYIAMVPVLKAAIKAKLAEEAQEAPFRLLLAGAVSQAHGVAVADVEQDLPELIEWWKLSNRWHRPLVGEPAAEGRAVKAIVQEWAARRLAAVDAERDAEMAKLLRGLHPDAICVARRRDGDYVAYGPANEHNIWLHEYRYSPKLGTPRPGRQWVQVSGRTRAALTILWSEQRWAGWNHRALTTEHLTGPELDDVIERLLNGARSEGQPIAVTYRELDRWDGVPRRIWAYVWKQDPPADAAVDPGQFMVAVVATWRRDQAGRIVLDGRVADRIAWAHYRDTKQPWQQTTALDSDRLVWSDPEQLARVEPIMAARAAKEAADSAAAGRAWRIERKLRDRWETAEWDRLYQRFLQDYNGATDLWDGHKKTLRVNFPEPSWFRDTLSHVVRSGIDVTGMTVAEALTAADRADTSVNPTVADMLLIDPTDPPEE
jgi:hypothetical protein